jgi:hypothetical protein
MRIKTALKIADWAAAAAGFLILATTDSSDFPFIPFMILSAAALHLAIDSAALFRSGSYVRRLAGLSEFSGHEAYAAKDLRSALAGDGIMDGVSLPAIIEGEALPRGKQPNKKAPLSGAESLAWSLEAELLEGLAEVPGPVFPVDSWWGQIEIRDSSGSIGLAGPGILDAAGWTQKKLGLKGLGSDLPSYAEKIEEGLGLAGDKKARSAKILVRETALRPGDRVQAFGAASLAAEELRLEGNDTLDDPASLLVRAAKNPASSRMPRARGRALGMGAAGLLCAAGAVALGLGPVEKRLSKPGGPLDPAKTGPVLVSLDGSALRVAIAGQSWYFEEGDARKALGLEAEDKPFLAARDAALSVAGFSLEKAELENGDLGYPRWDGSAWILEIGAAGGPAGSAGAAPAAAKSAPASARGRLYVRNLTKSKLGIRLIGDDGKPSEESWSFAALEAAGDPAGHYLSYSAGGEPRLGPSSRVEITAKDGSRRVLSLARAASWRESGSWLLELVPELVAGSGKLYVANRSDRPLRIWLVGADGASLFGEEPWTFEPKEGATENRGLSLQSGGKDIRMTGRERIRLAYLDLVPRFEGALEKAASRKSGRWLIDASALRR